MITIVTVTRFRQYLVVLSSDSRVSYLLSCPSLRFMQSVSATVDTDHNLGTRNVLLTIAVAQSPQITLT